MKSQDFLGDGRVSFPEMINQSQKFFVIRMSDDGLKTVLQEVCCNRKFVADFRVSMHCFVKKIA
jgi:hypothetical protein